MEEVVSLLDVDPGAVPALSAGEDEGAFFFFSGKDVGNGGGRESGRGGGTREGGGGGSVKADGSNRGRGENSTTAGTT